MNTDNPIKINHNGTEIVYHEKENSWLFTLRGRDRSAPSLEKAKEFIDKVPKAAKPFERIKCWIKDAGWRFAEDDDSKWRQVEVTSITERGGSVWITNGKTRSKEFYANLFPCNPKNDELVRGYESLEVKIRNLKKEQAAVEKKLKTLELPKEEEIA